ncbi:MAG: glycosyltransferase family 2 protein [Planctomycetaceae bacterium]
MTASGTAEGRDASIVVAVLTHKRADTLRVLLDTFAGIDPPASSRTTLLVIDNDAAGSAREIVAAARDRLGDVRYVVEPRRGISVARNRAIDEALALGADALCFIDDDEYPHREWLARLAGCWRRTGAHLVGGPVRVAPAAAGLTGWQRWVNRSLAAWTRRKNDKAGRVAAAGRSFQVFTNNWLCDLGWLRRSGLRFDERLNVSGGEDTAFCRAAQAAGCVSAWCPEAVVLETIERGRLSLRYQFHRAASQAVTHFRLRSPRVTPGFAVLATAASVAKTVVSLVLLVVPVLGWASLLTAVRGLGWSFGRLRALVGAESRLYA